MIWWYIAILLVMTLLGSFAGLFLKRASASNGIWAMAKNYNLYLGAGLYLMAALLNVYVLRHLDYSFVLPFTAITYVWTMLVSYFVLKEKITVRKIVGVCLIVGGALVIAIF